MLIIESRKVHHDHHPLHAVRPHPPHARRALGNVELDPRRGYYREEASMNTCCSVLLSDNMYVIMTEYLDRYKGGRCDLYGRKVTNSRGGSQSNPQNAVHHTKVFERWSDTSNQTGRWYMAHKRIVGTGVSRKADVQTREVNWLFLPATPRMPIPLIPLTQIGIPMVTLPVDDFTHGDRHVSSVPLHAFL